MAWEIDSIVRHGIIDNTVEGRTTGQIWLSGRTEPLCLDLIGDCWRDLAGTRLSFKNPNPESSGDFTALTTSQKGIIGDMSASRKYKIATDEDDAMSHFHDPNEPIPFEWKNILYLEWFSETNGRVVIEAADYEMEISEHFWQMDADAENAQKMANLNAMRDFMAQIIHRQEPKSNANLSEEMDEFAWEERLKESERLSDAYHEVLEKYMDEADSEQNEAFVMGWDGLLAAMAQREDFLNEQLEALESEENEKDDDLEHLSLFDMEDEDQEEEKEEETSIHPLQEKARELAMRAMDLLPKDALPGSAAYRLTSSLLEVSGKLAGALNGRSSGHEPETGYILAVLKRCLNWLNDALGSCQELMSNEEDTDHLAALAHLRCTAFEIRDAITELRRQLR